jgi:hypothetical protein
MDALQSCEAAGMSRYEVIEWMNMADGVRRMIERDPSGTEIAAQMTALLPRALSRLSAKKRKEFEALRRTDND